MYAAAGCPLVLACVVREPRAALLSFFEYFLIRGAAPNSHPLKIPGIKSNRSVAAAALGRWTNRTREYQLAWLAGDASTLAPQALDAPCDERSSRALRVLAQMDVVGVQERLRDMLWLLGARLGAWLQPCDGGAAGAPRAGYLACNVVPWRSLLTELPEEVEEVLKKRVNCSLPLYAAALAREEAQQTEAKQLAAEWPTPEMLAPLDAPLQCAN